MIQTNTNERSLAVVLADSNLSIRAAIVEELRLDRHLVISCGNCHEVEQALSSQMPDLLILGNLSEISYLEAYRKYSSQCQDLPIILLTAEPNVNQFFRDWAVAKGVYDVLSSASHSLHLLRARIHKLAYPEYESSLVPIFPTPVLFQAKQESIPQVVETDVVEVKDLTPDLLPSSPSLSLTFDQVLAELNQITEFSKRYFGEMVLGNYWKKAHKSSVTEHPWLSCWQIEYNGAISYINEEIPQAQLTDQQYQSVKLWVKGFLKECDRIICDYTELIQQKGLSNQIISPA